MPNIGAIILGTFAAIGVCTVLLTFVLMRARSRARLERRIAMVSGKPVGGKDGAGDKRKGSQKRLLMQSKLDEATKAAKGKGKADRQTMRQKLDTDGTNISRSGDEKDDSDLTTASLSAKFRPIDELALNLGIRRVDSYSQFDPVDFFDTGKP